MTAPNRQLGRSSESLRTRLSFGFSLDRSRVRSAKLAACDPGGYTERYQRWPPSPIRRSNSAAVVA